MNSTRPACKMCNHPHGEHYSQQIKAGKIDKTNAGRALGISETSVRRHMEHWQTPVVEETTVTGPRPLITEEVKQNRDGSVSMNRATHQRIHTLEQLVDFFEIDLNEWEIVEWTANKWEVTAFSKTAGQIIDADTRPLYQVKARLKPRKEIFAGKEAIQNLKDNAVEILSTARKSLAAPAPRKPPGDSPYMLELSIPDLHLGKLSWAKETGYENYDTKIAVEVFRRALASLLERTAHLPFRRVLFVVGNDILNADNYHNTTTSGTQQHTDVRYQKSFLSAQRMLVESIERIKETAPVDVMIVPGNHDQISAWTLGNSLECWFRQDKHVNINNYPTLRKFYRWGNVMLMFTHGDKGRKLDYPLLMATEEPEMFGATRYREVHTGHLHKVGLEEKHGVRVRILPTLCAADAWHSENTFTGNLRSAEAYVWHAEEGLVATATHIIQDQGQWGYRVQHEEEKI